MSVEASAVAGIGLIFETRRQVGEWFLENFKGELTLDERKLIEEEFDWFLESTRKPGMPKMSCLNCYSGDGYALLYDFDSTSMPSFKQSIDDAIALWDKQFKEAPTVIQTVRWY